MPEFLHNFTAGKMNKDLDERLVPNGEYRDALNLEITDSDNSDVGALQNIRGNVRLFDRYYNIATGVSTPWDSNYYIDSLIDAKCIGKIVDNTTERIYWFISSNNANAIAEYDQKLNIITPILVEYKSVSNFLNFSPDYLITGINIIEGLLFWTDNQTEPKTINIEFWRGSTTDFISHSQIYGRNFIEIISESMRFLTRTTISFNLHLKPK